MRTILLTAGGLILLLLILTTIKRGPNSVESLETMSSAVPDDPWFQENVLSSQQPVLVEFTATWCGFCKQMAVVLEDIEKEYGDRIKIVPVDVDEHPQVSDAYEVSGIPALMVVKDGKIKAYAPGLMRYENVEQLIKPFLGVARIKNVEEEKPTGNADAPEKEQAEAVSSSSQSS